MDSENKKINAACDMLRLCVCALTGRGGETVDRSTMALADVYRMSTFNGLVSLVSEGIEKLGIERTEENAPVLDAFVQARAMAVRKNLLLDTERATILSHLEENGIWYMPLKGVILKDMYPKLGLRQMSDNDILFDGAFREHIRDYFLSLDYSIEHYNEGFHDVYHKKPIFNYEMHVELYGENWVALQDYYKDVKKRLIKDDDNGFGYHFTDEDFYIFLVFHAYKHFALSESIGARHLIDVFVYLKKKPNLDFEYIENELNKLGVWQFDCDCRELVCEIFDKVETFDIVKLSDGMRKTLEAFMLNMFNISKTVKIDNSIKKKGKFGYVMSRIFPGVKFMGKYKPIFGHWYMLPVGWVYRAFDIMFNRSGKIASEMKIVAKTKQKKDKE
ncbi:MAG: nucleotidyltransferase family protein [Clostridia bacterium]|nr:nucleotidyltransferase family protein [Clostridia bacterium]